LKKTDWTKKFRIEMKNLLDETQKTNRETGFSVFRKKDTGELIKSSSELGFTSMFSAYVDLPKKVEGAEYVGGFHTHLETSSPSPTDIAIELENASESFCIGVPKDEFLDEEAELVCYKIDWNAIDKSIEVPLEEIIEKKNEVQSLKVLEERVRQLEDLDEPEITKIIDYTGIEYYIVGSEGEPLEEYTIGEFRNALEDRISEVTKELNSLSEEISPFIKSKKMIISNKIGKRSDKI
jgi:hypothetical protein